MIGASESDPIRINTEIGFISLDRQSLPANITPVLHAIERDPGHAAVRKIHRVGVRRAAPHDRQHAATGSDDLATLSRRSSVENEGALGARVRKP
jgi:hypothetical protein